MIGKGVNQSTPVVLMNGTLATTNISFNVVNIGIHITSEFIHFYNLKMK